MWGLRCGEAKNRKSEPSYGLLSNAFSECGDSSSPVTTNRTQTLKRLTPELLLDQDRTASVVGKLNG